VTQQQLPAGAAGRPQLRWLTVGLLLRVGSLMRAGLLEPAPDGCSPLGWQAASGEWLSQVGWASRAVPPVPPLQPHRSDSNRPPQAVPSPRGWIAAALAVAAHRARALPRPVLVLLRSLEIRWGGRCECRVRTPPAGTLPGVELWPLRLRTEYGALKVTHRVDRPRLCALKRIVDDARLPVTTSPGQAPREHKEC
jgi:hypothetical protein